MFSSEIQFVGRRGVRHAERVFAWPARKVCCVPYSPSALYATRVSQVLLCVMEGANPHSTVSIWSNYSATNTCTVNGLKTYLHCGVTFSPYGMITVDNCSMYGHIWYLLPRDVIVTWIQSFVFSQYYTQLGTALYSTYAMKCVWCCLGRRQAVTNTIFQNSYNVMAAWFHRKISHELHIFIYIFANYIQYNTEYRYHFLIRMLIVLVSPVDISFVLLQYRGSTLSQLL